jgi:hypothetical protein
MRFAKSGRRQQDKLEKIAKLTKADAADKASENDREGYQERPDRDWFLSCKMKQKILQKKKQQLSSRQQWNEWLAK